MGYELFERRRDVVGVSSPIETQRFGENSTGASSEANATVSPPVQAIRSGLRPAGPGPIEP
jgi:hypothetical protein